MQAAPIPICRTCGSETSRTGSRFGESIYTCTKAHCPDQFKVKYKRQSVGVPHLQRFSQ